MHFSIRLPVGSGCESEELEVKIKLESYANVMLHIRAEALPLNKLQSFSSLSEIWLIKFYLLLLYLLLIN